jgi:hypothetical protein
LAIAAKQLKLRVAGSIDAQRGGGGGRERENIIPPKAIFKTLVNKMQ